MLPLALWLKFGAVCASIGFATLWRRPQKDLARFIRTTLTLGLFALGLSLILSEVTVSNFPTAIILILLFAVATLVAISMLWYDPWVCH
jgi:hypothetical protein